MNEILEKAYTLRRILHENPESSLAENKTLDILRRFIQSETSFTVYDRGKYFYVKVPGSSANPPIAFRADVDAVTDASGCAKHLCGHDGHAATLAALALYLQKNKPFRTVYLIFQPAEEIGFGARLCKPVIQEEGIERIFAYHNIPGYPQGKVLFRYGTFACASTGLEISIKGRTAHAAYPETGKNPSNILAELVLLMNDLVDQPHKGIVLGTVIGISAGSDKYGVSASEGILRLTLRGEFGCEFDSLVSSIKESAIYKAQNGGFELSIKEIERFSAVENDQTSIDSIRIAALRSGIDSIELLQPFRWSEDFGEFLQEIPGAMFGIGDGEEHAQLHTETFEYPDAILEPALKIFIQLANQ